MFLTVDLLINCVCCAFIGAAIPLVIFEVLADLRDKREEKEDAIMREWRHK